MPPYLPVALHHGSPLQKIHALYEPVFTVFPLYIQHGGLKAALALLSGGLAEQVVLLEAVLPEIAEGDGQPGQASATAPVARWR